MLSKQGYEHSWYHGHSWSLEGYEHSWSPGYSNKCYYLLSKNYCSLIWGKCSEKQLYEVQKCINIAAKVASNGKYFKRDRGTPLLRDLKWINFNRILRLNEASFMYKNLYFSAIQMWKILSLISETRYRE